MRNGACSYCQDDPEREGTQTNCAMLQPRAVGYCARVTQSHHDRERHATDAHQGFHAPSYNTR
jgi:hypothetical protein